MNKNNINLYGFTLIELLVAISIIGIIGLSATNLNFNKISNKEKLNIYNNKIISNIETIRNNSLMGKGVGIDIIIPDLWRIDFSKSGSGKMLVSYNTGGLITSFPEKNIIFTGGYYIDTISCFDILSLIPIHSFTGNILGTGTLFISGNHITGSGSIPCNNPKTKKIEIITGYKGFTGSILINTVSGLIQKKY